MANQNSFGHFLSHQVWEDATKLLNFQVDQKKFNKHFNTISMFYFEKLGSSRSNISGVEYFEKTIATNLFYTLEDEFRLHHYTLPKTCLTLRPWTFFSYPLRVLYYAIGLYFLKMTQEFLSEQFVERNPHFNTFYGGGIRYDAEKLILNPDKVYFKQYYQKFRSAIKAEASHNTRDKVIIKFDVENYFYEIPTDLLLLRVDSRIKSSIKAKLAYDTQTIEQIRFFFRFLMNNKKGIPVTDNDVISGYLGHLYLSFADLEIDDLLDPEPILGDHHLIRYVDDYYISLTFMPNTPRQERADFITYIASRISDIFHESFDLRLNAKTEVYWLEEENSRKRLISNLKRVSNSFSIVEDEEEGQGEEGQDRLDQLLSEVEHLKKFNQSCIYERTIAFEDEILKHIYDTRVDQLLHKPENVVRLTNALNDFNFHLVKLSPSELILLIMKDPSARARFKSFLLSLAAPTTTDNDLILRFLAQTNFTDEDLMTKLRTDKRFKGIISALDKADLNLENSGYFDLTQSQIAKLAKMPNVLEQGKLRVLSERIGSFSVALNHLLNEIHSLCGNLDDETKKSAKQYDAILVAAFLRKKRLPNNIIIDIANLFDRRNNNQVSHPGSDHYMTWGVTEEEYAMFKSAVAKCFNRLL